MTFSRSLSRPRILLAAAVLLALGAGQARAEDLWPDLSQAAKGIGGGEKDAAVIVAVQSYAKVAPVPGALQNANDWHAFLTGSLHVPVDRVALLRDEDATLEVMRPNVQKAAQEVEPDGTLWFVFIGHGAPSKDGKDGLLVGWDAQQKVESLFSRSLSQEELLSALGAGKQARTVVLIDACFSGRTPEGAPLAPGLQPLIVKLDGGAARIAASRTILLSAARSDQFAGPLPGASRPAFSYLALGGLRGWADEKGEGKVTAEGLVGYVGKALRAVGASQQPELAAFSQGQLLPAGKDRAPDFGEVVRKLSPAEPEKKGSAFQVSSLPSLPSVEAPKALAKGASGFDWNKADVEALEKYDAAFAFDQGEASDEEKAKNWRKLAKNAPQLAEMAKQRAAEWEGFAQRKMAAEKARKERVPARDSDWKRLSRLLSLKVVSEEDKRQWSKQFAQAYMDHPGIEAAQAALLAPNLPSGPEKDALAKVAVGMQWIPIQGGTFIMGEDGTQTWWKPAHKVSIKGFEMSKTEVTFKQYRACVEAGACSPAHTADGTCAVMRGSDWKRENLPVDFLGDDQPIVCVDWSQADSFARWVGGRLPSEAEWEYAAKSAGKNREYPWGGGGLGCRKAVMDDGDNAWDPHTGRFPEPVREGCGRRTTWPVCSKSGGNTDQGLCDMAGNAAEFVQDAFHDSYLGAPSDGSSWGSASYSKALERGGAWSYAGAWHSATARHPLDASQTFATGFRVARDRKP